MGTFSFTYSNRPTGQRTPGRARDSRKRFQCDLFEFWRQCPRTRCQRIHACSGRDPHACFAHHQAALPDDHKDWARAAILAKSTGTATVEQIFRAVGLAL